MAVSEESRQNTSGEGSIAQAWGRFGKSILTRPSSFIFCFCLFFCLVLFPPISLVEMECFRGWYGRTVQWCPPVPPLVKLSAFPVRFELFPIRYRRTVRSRDTCRDRTAPRWRRKNSFATVPWVVKLSEAFRFSFAKKNFETEAETSGTGARYGRVRATCDSTRSRPCPICLVLCFLSRFLLRSLSWPT